MDVMRIRRRVQVGCNYVADRELRPQAVIQSFMSGQGGWKCGLAVRILRYWYGGKCEKSVLVIKWLLDDSTM